MARSATDADLVHVMYEHVDSLRRKIGVAPIRLARTKDGPPGLTVSVMPGMRHEVPPSVVLKIRREEVEIPLLPLEDYL